MNSVQRRIRERLNAQGGAAEPPAVTKLWPAAPEVGASEEEWQHFLLRRAAVDTAALVTIRKHLGIEPGPNADFELAMTLAKMYHPLFQGEYGRPDKRSRKKWTPYRLALLWAEAEAVVEEGAGNERSAVRVLTKREPWARVVGGGSDPEAALARQLAYAKKIVSKRSLGTLAKSRKLSVVEGRLDEWQASLQGEFDDEP